jgi:hypothetical protein
MIRSVNRKLARWVLAVSIFGAVVAGTVVGIRAYQKHRTLITLRGAIIKQDSDTRKQTPIADVEISSVDGLAVRDAKSNFSGAFNITLQPGVKMGQIVRLAFHHPDFQPLVANEKVGDDLYIVRMVPLHETVEATDQAETKVTNVLVRYSTQIMRTENVTSAEKTFQIVNSGNVPCDKQSVCSPDGIWRAQVGSASLDAGEGNVFRDARVTCIAGPCPFTRIDEDAFSRGGRTIGVSIRNWSDTTTFLLQAEVYRSQLENTVRQTYPVIFGRSMNFTLPSAAEGPSIEAVVSGTSIVFPLGPTPVLSWANCQVRIEKNQTKDYRCELKSGYEFQ